MAPRAALYLNGSFYARARRTRQREALAAFGGRVLYVGDEGAAKDAFPQGVSPEVIDLEGRTVLPGFVDSHLHLMNLGLGLANLQLAAVTSIEELKVKLRQRAETTPPGEWILGRGWDQDFFVEKRYPTKKDLDEAAGQRAVYLTRACGHLAVVSSKALETAGITRDTPDPPGGIIDRDMYGEPTGVLRESAQGLVRGKVPERGRETVEAATGEAMKYLLARGITSIHPNDGYEGVRSTMEVYRKAHGSGVPLRIYWDMPYDFLEELSETPLRTGDGDDYLRVGAVKIFADGSLGGRTAALDEPYSDERDNSGILVTSEEDLTAQVYRAHALGMQVAVHAIGDRAVRVSLDAVNEAQSRLPRRSLRHRLVHVQILSPFLITEMRRVGVVADVQPKFLTTDMRWAQERVGSQRMRSSYSWHTMLKAGIPLAGGSDCPVEPPDPLFGIYAAVTRKDMEGNPRGAYYPNERITLEEAIRMFTLGGAYAAFQDDQKGTLQPGKLADFVVLSEDPFRMPAEDIKDLSVLMTVVGGEVAYEKP